MSITGLCFKSLDEVENGVNDHLITNAGVDHAVWTEDEELQAIVIDGPAETE